MIAISKLSTTYFVLSITILGTSVTVPMISTTTTAYAQTQQQRGGGGACPDGFTKNKGVCEKEPTLTCENYNVYQPRTNIDENGDCIVTEYTTAVCLNEEGTQILGYYFPGNTCIDNATKRPVPNAEPACSSPTQPWHPINTATLTTERGPLNASSIQTLDQPTRNAMLVL